MRYYYVISKSSLKELEKETIELAKKYNTDETEEFFTKGELSAYEDIKDMAYIPVEIELIENLIEKISGNEKIKEKILTLIDKLK